MAHPVFLYIAYTGKVSVLHVVYHHFYEIRTATNFRDKPAAILVNN